MQIRRCLENWRIFKNFFHCFIGCRLSCSEILNKYKNLPLTFHIQLSLICMFVDNISNKYIFNHSEYVQIKLPPRETMRRKCFNPIKLLRGSTAVDSFFSRSPNIYNYLHRHSIIELNDCLTQLCGSALKNFAMSKVSYFRHFY